MNEPVVDPLAGAGPLLWAAAFVTVALAAIVALGYVRQRGRDPRRGQRMWCLLAGAGAVASGVWSAMLLGLSSESLAIPIGYVGIGIAAGWLGAAGAALLAVLALGRWPTLSGAAAAGALLSLGVVACDMLLVRSAGFQPGIDWQYDALAMALPLAALGCGGGCWLGLVALDRRGRRRRWWRGAAALTMALAIIGAQELVLAAAGLSLQTGSAYQGHVPALVVCLIGGTATPMVLLLLLLDLRLRRLIVDPAAPPLRKRRRVRRGRPLG